MAFSTYIDGHPKFYFFSSGTRRFFLSPLKALVLLLHFAFLVPLGSHAQFIDPADHPRPFRWYQLSRWSQQGLICFGSLPPGKYGHTSRTASDYQSLAELCSTDGVHAYNLQGYCTQFNVNFKNKIRFRWSRVNQALRDPHLGELCQRSCICRHEWIKFLKRLQDPQDTSAREVGDLLNSEFISPLPVPYDAHDAGLGVIGDVLITSQLQLPALLKELLFDDGSDDPMAEYANDEFTEKIGEMVKKGQGQSSQCGGNCDGYHCPGEENGCRCTVSKVETAKWVPKGCRIVHDDLRRRDRRRATSEVISCPCNGTYISDACCDSKDGLVWEPPSMQLGANIAKEL